MAILGLILVAIAAVVGAETALSNESTVTVETFGLFSALPVWAIFLVGALCALVATLGLFLITGSAQRRRVVRRDAKHRMRDQQTVVTDTERTSAELAEENDRLRAELAAERRAAATMGGVAVPPGTGDVPYGDQVSDAVRSDTISQTGHFEPYPAESRRADTEAVRYDGDAATADDKAGVIGRFRGTDR